MAAINPTYTFLKVEDFVSKFGWSAGWVANIQQSVDAGNLSFEEPQIVFEEFTKGVFMSLYLILEDIISLAHFKNLVTMVVDELSKTVNSHKVNNYANNVFVKKSGFGYGWSAMPKQKNCTADFWDQTFFREDLRDAVQQGQNDSLPSAESPSVQLGQLLLSTPQSHSSYTAVLPTSAGTPYTSGTKKKDSHKTLRKRAVNVEAENTQLKLKLSEKEIEIQQLKEELVTAKLTMSGLRSTMGRLKRTGANDCPVLQKKPKSNRLAEQSRSEIFDTLTAGEGDVGEGSSAVLGDVESSWLVDHSGVRDVIEGKKDFIVIESRNESDEGLFHGTEYFGKDSNKLLSTTGNQFVFARVKRHLDKKVHDSRNTFVAKSKRLRDILSFFVGSSWDDVTRGTAGDDRAVIRLLGCFFRKYSVIFDKLTEGSLQLMMKCKMTAKQAVDFKGLLGLSEAMVRRMRVILKKFDLNIFPSERPMRIETASRISFLETARMCTERVQMASGKPPRTTNVDVVKAGDLAAYIGSVYKLGGPHRDFCASEKTIQIVIGGDKGGETMKFHFQLVHPETNVYDCHMFCFYKGSDKAQSMRKVLPPFNASIEVMSSTGLEGLSVEFFLGGDFKFLDAVLGHQGSSATYPSPKDDCTIGHLQKHGKRAHTPKDCPDILVRSTNELFELYNENLADSNEGDDDFEVFESSADGLEEESLSGDSDDDETDDQVVKKRSLKDTLNSNGKKHGSIVAPSMLRAIDLDNVVPPVLHITLGIVLRLFNKLLALCRSLDKPSQSAELERIDILWEKKSIELSNAEDLLRGSGREMMDRKNHLLRLEVIKNAEGEEELERIARDCFVGKGPTRAKDFYFCDNPGGNSRGGVSCVLTAWDFDLAQVQCNFCDQWYHCICEGIVTANYSEVRSREEYKCVRCDHPQNAAIDLDFFINYVNAKSFELEKQQIEFDNLLVSLTDECTSLKSQHEENVGPKEKQLLSVLDDLHVDRQAYHGNVFVGNHCKIILKNYDALLRVISGDAEIAHHYTGFSLIFECFAGAHELMSAKRRLTDMEIENLTEFCHTFGRVYPEYFPEVPCLTRKMHSLIFDVPRFANKHKSVGLYAEEGGESLHKIIKQQRRVLACIRKPGQQLLKIHQAVEVVGRSDRSLAIPLSRKCKKCGGWFGEKPKNPCTCPS